MSNRTQSAKSQDRPLVVSFDPHPFVRVGLQNLFEQEPDLEFCGSPVCSFPKIPAEIVRLNPRLVILPLSFKTGSGLDLIKYIHANHPDLLVLVFTMHGETFYAERALRAGARGYITKDEPGETILLAVRTVLAGGIYVSDLVSRGLLLKLSDMVPRILGYSLEDLSLRELEILEMVGQHESSKKIAEAMEVGLATVKGRLAEIKRKFGISTNKTLLKIAVEWVRLKSG